MAKLFGIDIAAIVDNAVSDQLIDLTLTSYVDSAVEESDPTAAPTRTPTEHTGKGVITDYSDFHRAQTTIQDGDRKLLIIANSLDIAIIPEPGFTVTMESVTYTIVGPVKVDPAIASYTCQVRP